MEKQRQFAVRQAAMHLAKLRRQEKSQVMPQMLLPGNSQMMAKLLVTADPPSPRLRRASWRPPLLVRQDLRRRRVTEIPRASVRARQCWRGPDPFAFFREIPDAEK